MKRLIIILVVLLLCFTACTNEYHPVIKTPAPTPEPTPEPYDPQKYTLGIYGAPNAAIHGFIEKCDELSYNYKVFDTDLTEALSWARNAECGLLIYGASENDRALINETAAYGGAIITAFFESEKKPLGALRELSFATDTSAKICAGILADKLDGSEGALLICGTNNDTTDCEDIFRTEWELLKSTHKLDSVELIGKEYCDNLKQVNNVLARKQGIKAVYAASAESAVLWADAVKDLEEKPIIISDQVSVEYLEYVKSGIIEAAYIYPDKELGETAVIEMDAFLRGEQLTNQEIPSGTLADSKSDINSLIELLKDV
ncbi:MAG: hypothetical protein IJD14_05380 [Christensenellaceae bacterium]|nr:hypothetical protein [Christensenellaceae bacterium]